MSRFALLLLAAASTVSKALYTSIPSGHVGVYVNWGQIDENYYTGVQLYNPFFSTIVHVKTVQDTDISHNVRCVSKEGVNIDIPSIEIANSIDPTKVVNTIIQYGFNYDTVLVLNPLGQFMRELCANRTVDDIEIHDFRNLDDLLKVEIQRQVNEINSGILIHWVRITNVVVPQVIKEKRLELAAEKAKKTLVEQEALRIVVQKQTEADVQAADLRRLIAQEEMKNRVLVMGAEAELAQKDIQNQIMLNSTKADSEKSRIMAMAAADKKRMDAAAEADQIRTLSVANAERLSRESVELRKFYEITGYAEVQKVQALSSNTKVYFGDNLPGNMWLGSNHVSETNNMPTSNTNPSPNTVPSGMTMSDMPNGMTAMAA
jgi:regulator of protease activity HflC (stomatin/prohibitin superfamily)